jgi:hypothetical protein
MSDLLNKYITSPIKQVGSFFYSTKPSGKGQEKLIETLIKHEYQQMPPFSYNQLPRVSKYFVKVAAISGLAAVVMSAYGSHG